mgnify:CR=1 FL=1
MLQWDHKCNNIHFLQGAWHWVTITVFTSENDRAILKWCKNESNYAKNSSTKDQEGKKIFTLNEFENICRKGKVF